MIEWSDLAGAPVAPADARVAHGPDPLQFGELRLPRGPGPFPIAVVIHGGCWRAEYDLRHFSQASSALARSGVATWTIEYRRLGDPGGGWPGTFRDVALGVDSVARLPERFRVLDSTRVLLIGHSAGGHLALWAASQDPEGAGVAACEAPSPPPVLPLCGVIGLAPITDLRAFGALSGDCSSAVAPLLGGGPEEVPGRYAAASPIERVPIAVPVQLVHGALDPIVPVAQSRTFLERNRAGGGSADLHLVAGAGHFDLIAPGAPAWGVVVEAVGGLLLPG
jgi:acetyl esterase/lipase